MSDNVSNNVDAFINGLEDAIRASIELSCQTIENAAKRNCPVDDGILKASITHIIDDSSTYSTFSDEVVGDKVVLNEESVSASGMGFNGVIGTNVFYAPYVHEGTGIYARGGMGRKQVPWRYKTPDGKWHTTKGQKSNPFLLNALDSNRQKILNIFKRTCGVNNIKAEFCKGGFKV